MPGTVGLPPIPNMPSRHAQGEICFFIMDGELSDKGTEMYFEADGSNFGRTKAEGSVWYSLAFLGKQRDIIPNSTTRVSFRIISRSSLTNYLST